MPKRPNDNFEDYKVLAGAYPLIFSELIVPGGPDFEGVTILILHLNAGLGNPSWEFTTSLHDGEYFIDVMEAVKAICLSDLAETMPDNFTLYEDQILGKVMRFSYVGKYTGGDTQESLDEFWILAGTRPIGLAPGPVLVPYDPETADRAPLIPLPMFTDETTGLTVGRLKVFLGYPFDIPIVPKGAGGTVEVTDEGLLVASHSWSGSTSVCLVRIPIITSSANNPHLSMAEGNHTWTIEFDGEEDASVMDVEIVDKCGGLYLRWINSLGTFSNWLFGPLWELEEDNKTVEDYATFVPASQSIGSNRSPLSKQHRRTIKTADSGLTEAEVRMIAEISHSPLVLLYKNDDLAQYIGTDLWREVDIPKLKPIVSDATRKIFDIEIEISLPETYRNTM